MTEDQRKLAEVRRVRDGYASQARFADQAAWNRWIDLPFAGDVIIGIDWSLQPDRSIEWTYSGVDDWRAVYGTPGI